MTATGSAHGWRVGVDTGGTFTDLVAVSPAGDIRLVKVSSTPAQPADATFEALERTGLDLRTDLESFVLGTTIATNAVIQRRGARTVFVTTAGFEDLLYIQRIDRRGLYDLQWVKSVPYAERRLTLGVHERILADGSVLMPLTDQEIARVVAAVAELVSEEQATAVAISLLFSYVNASHEGALAGALRTALPACDISVSSEVAPIWREYERSSTTVIDAYVKPIVSRFAQALGEGLDARGVGGVRSLMKSNGGQVPLPHAAQRPVEMVLSGLAGGMIAGQHWARAVGSQRAVTLDMGGTSADVGVLVDGQLVFSGLFEVEWGVPVTLPIIDVTTVGAGGSSIASVDRSGLLKVGPESAGANPGPACYGKGGTAPTVTDANLLIGRLDGMYFLGGELPLDMERARTAMSDIASALGLSVDDAAHAVITLGIENMSGAVRLVTVDRGLDYRDFDLLAYGGAGPLHAVELAQRLGMRRVVIPPSPGLVSAFGAVIADERVDRRATVVRRLDKPEAADLPAELEKIAAATVEELMRHSPDPRREVTLMTHIACRYVGQNYEQEVRMYHGHVDKTYELAIALPPTAPDFVAQLAERFHARHEQAYGYAMRDQPIQTVYLGATALFATKPVQPQPYSATPQNGTGEKRRRILVAPGEYAEATVLMRAVLQPGRQVDGPAVIEEPNSTTYVPPGCRLVVDDTYCMMIERLAPAGEAR